MLAGCSQAPAAEPGSYAAMSAGSVAACDTYKGGEAVDQIKVEGAFGEEPTATFPTPLTGTGIETKVISAGTGGKLVGNQRVALHFTGYNASTGKQFQGSEFGSEDYIIQDILVDSLPNFCKALTGVEVGSRVAVLLDSENAHQSQGVESLGIGAEDSIIFIFDVVDAYLQRASGEAQAPVAGLPTVILAPNGQPGIQIPVGDAPTEFKRSVLIEGSGAEIAIGDTVVVHYSGWTWEGEQFDSSWESLAPTSFQVSAESVIQGFVQSLEGVKIGSQVVAVIPPELGYGDNAQGSIPAGSTLIFVIDVLGKE
jgi:FKBP-type peptidyl-prolyl cis-trans isomerase